MNTTCKCFLLLILPPFLFCGCEKLPDSNAGYPEKSSISFMNDTLWIQYNKTVVLANSSISLTFDSIFSDSRCPEDLICIWGGAFRIGLKLSDTDQCCSFTLSTYPRENPDTIIAGYSVAVIDLLPYPNSNFQYDLNCYKTQIRIACPE